MILRVQHAKYNLERTKTVQR